MITVCPGYRNGLTPYRLTSSFPGLSVKRVGANGENMCSTFAALQSLKNMKERKGETMVMYFVSFIVKK